VHAFPNAKLDLDNTFPIALSNLSSLTLDVSWSYGLGNSAPNETDNGQLSTADMNANVALDMFLGPDATKSTNTTTASYEVMLWLGRWGAATQPIGLPQGSKATLAVNDTTLYVRSWQREALD
jgi:Glycosyl hydrolase family 12